MAKVLSSNVWPIETAGGAAHEHSACTQTCGPDCPAGQAPWAEDSPETRALQAFLGQGVRILDLQPPQPEAPAANAAGTAPAATKAA